MAATKVPNMAIFVIDCWILNLKIKSINVNNGLIIPCIFVFSESNKKNHFNIFGFEGILFISIFILLYVLALEIFLYWYKYNNDSVTHINNWNKHTDITPRNKDDFNDKFIWKPIDIARTPGMRTFKSNAKIAKDVVQKNNLKAGCNKSRISKVTSSNSVQHVTKVNKNKDLHNVAHVFECVEWYFPNPFSKNTRPIIASINHEIGKMNRW